MLNYNFVRIITLSWFFLLFFAPSVYDPSVYAKMRTISEGDLAQIDAESGITLQLQDINVEVAATSVNIWTSSDGTKGISLPNFLIDNGNGTFSASNLNNSTPFIENANIVIDVGTLSNTTWLSIANLTIPSPGLSISSTNITIIDHDGTNTDKVIGDLKISGVYTMESAPSTPPYARTSSKAGGQGTNLYNEGNFRVDKVEFLYKGSGATTKMSITSIWLAQSFTGTTTSPSTWVPVGNSKIGNITPPGGTTTKIAYYGTAPLYAGFDFGTSGTTSAVQFRYPSWGSIRIKDFNMGWGAGTYTDFGPIVIDNMHTYQNTITFHQLPMF